MYKKEIKPGGKYPEPFILKLFFLGCRLREETLVQRRRKLHHFICKVTMALTPWERCFSERPIFSAFYRTSPNGIVFKTRGEAKA